MTAIFLITTIGFIAICSIRLWWAARTLREHEKRLVAVEGVEDRPLPDPEECAKFASLYASDKVNQLVGLLDEIGRLPPDERIGIAKLMRTEADLILKYDRA